MDVNQSPHDTPTELYSVSDAARILGITQEAIRSRLNRGTLTKVKMRDGSVMVRLDANHTQPDADHTNDHTVEDSVVYRLQADQIEFLRRELERKDSIIMQLTQRIPELEPAREASPEPRETSVTASEERAGGTAPVEDAEPERGSWWWRLLGRG